MGHERCRCWSTQVMLKTHLRIGFFTHHFLEPTHYAIASVLSSLERCEFAVFAKWFRYGGICDIPNVVERHVYTKGPVPVLEQRKVDIIHAVYDGKTALRAGAVAFELGVPFIVSFHGGFDTNAKIFDQRYTRATCRLCNAASAVTVVSRIDLERLRSIGVSRPIDVLPVPVDSRLIEVQEPLSGRLTSVGRLIPKKGIDVAIDALSVLPKSYRLDLVGDGELRALIKSHVLDLGLSERVLFWGLSSLELCLEITAKSRALVHSCRRAQDGNSEGVPQIVLWAQALGVPVVACDAGSVREVVEDRQTGLLCPPDDPLSVADAIMLLDTDRSLREKVVQNAKEQVKQHEIQTVVDKVYNIYERVLGL